MTLGNAKIMVIGWLLGMRKLRKLRNYVNYVNCIKHGVKASSKVGI